MYRFYDRDYFFHYQPGFYSIYLELGLNSKAQFIPLFFEKKMLVGLCKVFHLRGMYVKM